MSKHRLSLSGIFAGPRRPKPPLKIARASAEARLPRQSREAISRRKQRVSPLMTPSCFGRGTQNGFFASLRMTLFFSLPRIIQFSCSFHPAAWTGESRPAETPKSLPLEGKVARRKVTIPRPPQGEPPSRSRHTTFPPHLIVWRLSSPGPYPTAPGQLRDGTPGRSHAAARRHGPESAARGARSPHS